MTARARVTEENLSFETVQSGQPSFFRMFSLLLKTLTFIVLFEQMVHRTNLSELQQNKANASNTESAFLDFNLSNNNGIVSTRMHDKWDDFEQT